ncbi:hypothetical protein K505DRAFT_331095 [Melanomma pulvis-pyrius CBS 109.77]|uniref:Uncharacterized protein n=1 Tax=Melanomma pulvis-pyrius CBS 109.77 TaxID=1314802 RepID=A0A6A6XY69_9PLEO|nr:hypothetical protein K505DRAFT_331095 [Melanomma pulvis-pyrius CBS 109.77]
MSEVFNSPRRVRRASADEAAQLITQARDEARVYAFLGGEEFVSDPQRDAPVFDPDSDSESESDNALPEFALPTGFQEAPNDECSICSLLRGEMFLIECSGPSDVASYLDVYIRLKDHLQDHGRPIPIEEQLSEFTSLSPFGEEAARTHVTAREDSPALEPPSEAEVEQAFTELFDYERYEEDCDAAALFDYEQYQDDIDATS